jgi:HAD superfamily hydrolase (TIGR01484 family)
MQPIQQLPCALANAIVGVAFDVDDTLTDHGKLLPPALAALYRLQDARIECIAVTGRSAGFAEVLLGQLPIRAAVAETGALAFVSSAARPIQTSRATPAERAERSLRLAALVGEVKRVLPAAKLANDAHLRQCDVAWDVREFEQLSEHEIEVLLAVLGRAGARVTRSSIHVHASFDTDDKATGLLRVLCTHMGVDPTAARRSWAFIGDSGNDAAGFATFELSCGVANVRGHLARMTLTPRFVTHAERGAGFAEFVDTLLAKRDPRRT